MIIVGEGGLDAKTPITYQQKLRQPPGSLAWIEWNSERPRYLGLTLFLDRESVALTALPGYYSDDSESRLAPGDLT